ncbi:DUF4097 family beta strand repeat-containing protein [Paenibacillus sp. QZ-Y1]|uniref:DUF4097 family beta strand repeat-containing protein n=1 Tax=Paenibacillus sp. QZ-Y1 TaxID=3414511 RepID=UPI003F7A2858
MRAVPKYTKRNRIYIVLIVILLISGGVIFNNLFTNKINKVVKASATGIQHLLIYSPMVEVRLHHSSNRSEIQAELSGIAPAMSDFDLILETRDKTIELRTVGNNNGLAVLSTSTQVFVDVYLPDIRYETITLSTQFSSIFSDYSIRARQLNFTSTLGGLSLHSFEGEQLHGRTTLGSLRIEQLDGKAALQTSAGSIVIDRWNNSLTDSFIHSDRGNIYIGMSDPEDINPLYINLRSNGRVQTNLEYSSTAPPGDWRTIGMNKISGHIGRPGKALSEVSVSSNTGRITLLNLKQSNL